MSRIRDVFFRAARSTGVRNVRRGAGRFGAPGLNPEFEALRRELTESSVRFDQHMPAVLNAIASTNGTARLLRRDFDRHVEAVDAEVARVDTDVARLDADVARLRADAARLDGTVVSLAQELERLDGHIVRLNGHIADELWPLMTRAEALGPLNETVGWLLQRVETVRAEMLHELRYGPAKKAHDVEVEVVNAAAVESAAILRLNLGCGHLPLDGFVNVDMRKLPGVDVVAPLDAMPFERETVAEIFSAHVLEHFPQAELERQLLPYWYTLLAPNGEFRSVVPDVDAMIDQYRAGTISFENLREVVYGGQEYEGDFHHTAFTPESLSALLLEAGFVEPELIERGRQNGACLEFELTARRPA
jgi:predicted SAM-dependent methyltransferase